MIALHLGNGAAAAAIAGGCSIDTSMGLTPLEGLVMGTRSGDLDPGLILHLQRAGMTDAELDDLLNRRSGMLGLAGRSDLRDVVLAAEAGEPDAVLALDVYVHRIRRYLGAYAVALGGVDVIVFTAGAGETSVPIRARTLAGLEFLGVEVDEAANAEPNGATRRISAPGSRVEVLVVPTDEEREIAMQTAAVAGLR